MQNHQGYDFISVGSGAGGLSAAITVAEAGGRALVLEKDHSLGGVTALSGGQVWIGNSHLEEALGIDDSAQETEAYLSFLSDGFARPELRQVYVTQGPRVARYFIEQIGIPLRIIPEWPDYYFPDAPGSKGAGRFLEPEPFISSALGEWTDRSIRGDYVVTSEDRSLAGGSADELRRLAAGHVDRDERCAGAALSGHLIRAAMDRGVEFRVNTPAVRLITEGGRVVGVEAESGGETVEILSRHGVLLATSSYDWNAELVQTYEQLTGLLSATPETVTGDHIIMATELGASVVSARPSAANSVLYGFAVTEKPGEAPKYKLMIPGWPHSMIVNKAGERFCDDSFLSGIATAMGRYFGPEKGFANSPAWMVFDQSYRDKYPIGPYYPGSELPEGLVTVRDSLEELAEAVDIDPAGLKQSIDRFNGFSASGVDEDFDRGTRKYSRMMTGDHSRSNPNLGEIERGPFYAMDFLRVGVGIPTAGLKIDGEGRVINVRGGAIEGLYAAGNAASHMDIGAGYTSGIANARGMIYGHLAAVMAMRP